MGYCVTMTKAGYELQAKLFAEGGSFPITRVEVGKGVCPAGTDPARLTGLWARPRPPRPGRRAVRSA